MSDFAELLKGVASLLWVVLGLTALLILRQVLVSQSGSLRKLGIGPSGVTIEFVEAKIEQAVRGADEPSRTAIGQAAKRSVVDRLQRNADLIARARILWVDDHPENNAPIIELLQRYGATVETPQSNHQALALLKGARYDVIISDVARDSEGAGSDLKGVELAEQVYRGWSQRVLLFSARFDPANVPGMSVEERLDLVNRLDRAVFGRTNRTDEALHLVMDVLER